jgi:hypothetical protein
MPLAACNSKEVLATMREPPFATFMVGFVVVGTTRPATVRPVGRDISFWIFDSPAARTGRTGAVGCTEKIIRVSRMNATRPVFIAMEDLAYQIYIIVALSATKKHDVLTKVF